MNGKLVLSPQYAMAIGWSNPAGGMFSSMKDMMTFINHVSSKTGILSPDGYEEYFLPGVPLRDGVSSWSKYGYESIYTNDILTFTKTGTGGGFATTIAVIPELQFGAFSWSNLQSGLISSKVCLFSLIVPFQFLIMYTLLNSCTS